MANLIKNEFLCFLTVQYDKLDRDNLISTLVDFYSYRKAIDAKNILVTKCAKATLSESIKDFSIKRVYLLSGLICTAVLFL